MEPIKLQDEGQPSYIVKLKTQEYRNMGAQYTDIPMYQYTKPFTMGGVIYLKTTVLTFRQFSSLQ